MKALTWIAVLVLIATGCTHGEAEQSTQPRTSTLVDQGHRLATTYCASCHAIGVTGPSPNPMATPWRTLSNAYPADPLAEAFADGVVVGHPDMPRFRLTPSQIEALTAYMQSVQTIHRDGD